MSSKFAITEKPKKKVDEEDEDLENEEDENSNDDLSMDESDNESDEDNFSDTEDKTEKIFNPEKTKIIQKNNKDNNNDNNDSENDSDEDEDDDEEYDENYLQKLNENIKSKVITDYHSELISHSYDEVNALSIITRDEEGNIIDPFHKTLSILTKYELTRVLGERAKQLSKGAEPFIPVEEHIVDDYSIALMELKEKKIPFIIQRPLPNGLSEFWKLNDLEILLI